jgi:16S rRNA processing protein RimM
VVAPFGIKGELKVNILTEFPDRFKKLREVVLAPFASIEPGLAPTAALDPATLRSPKSVGARSSLRSGSPVRGPKSVSADPGLGSLDPALREAAGPDNPTPFTIQSTHIHKGQLLLKLEGVETANEAEALRGYWVLVPLENAQKLPRGAYYIYQIVGLEVFTEAGDLLGTVADVLTTSANDVYVVRGPGVREPSGELLVPVVKQVVKRIDPDHGRIVIADPREWA